MRSFCHFIDKKAIKIKKHFFGLKYIVIATSYANSFFGMIIKFQINEGISPTNHRILAVNMMK